MKNTTIFGIRAILEAINSGSTINKVFIQKGLDGDLFRELEAALRSNHISTSYVPIEKLNRLAKGNHQGAVAQISPIDFYAIEDLINFTLYAETTPLYLVLDQLSDVRNFGAIVRTAACTGVSGIIIPKNGSAPINGDAIKTSAGGLFNVPICKVNHIKDAIFYLQGSGISVIGATEKSNKVLYDVDFTIPCAIVMGSEGKGISSSVLKLCDDQSKLPILGNIESLNVSVACGAFLYEVVRQRMHMSTV